jgi:voltage-gated sodium channel
MAVNLYGEEFPELFGTLGTSLYTLFTIMTLEGWTNDVVNPIRKVHPYALLFFIPFIIITTFWVLNLFIGIIVNAMQEEHAKAEADAERDLIHGETAPLVREIQELKAEIAALRKEVSAAASGASSRRTKRSTAPN